MTQPATEPKFENLEEDDHLMPLNEWLEGVKIFAFIDYDGYGHLATATQKSDQLIEPTDVSVNGFVFPAWATHIVWYNR